jgi:hypothetical protein
MARLQNPQDELGHVTDSEVGDSDGQESQLWCEVG